MGLLDVVRRETAGTFLVIGGVLSDKLRPAWPAASATVRRSTCAGTTHSPL